MKLIDSCSIRTGGMRCVAKEIHLISVLQDIQEGFLGIILYSYKVYIKIHFYYRNFISLIIIQFSQLLFFQEAKIFK